MIDMRAMRHHFYLELICRNCFAHSGLVWRAPSMEILNSFLLCILVNCWEIISNNIYSIFNKNKRKAVNQMLLRYSCKLFINIFIKVVAVRHSKWKVFQKQIFHLTSTIYVFLWCSTEKQTQPYKYQNNSPYFSYFFFKFPFFRFSCFHLFCVLYFV